MKNSLFLQYDSCKNDSNRFLIFATNENLDLLSNFPNWYVDRTFDVPEMFTQMFTVHVIRKGKNLPCLYALLPSKKEEAYNSVASFLKIHVKNEPRTLTLDFEMAITNAFLEEFEDCESYGCFFHFK